MFYGDTPQDTRSLFYTSWQKHRMNQAISTLEKQIIAVIVDHPEYHALLETHVSNPNTAYFPELGQTNPFLHMGLHLAIRDQVATDKPTGITSIYNTLIKKHIEPLTVEHLLLEPLAECLWQAQRNQGMMDELHYLQACRKLLTS